MLLISSAYDHLVLQDIELRHLHALRAVAQEGSFGRAAERLGFTQSAISQQIASLERVLGEKVFDRRGGPRPVELTPAEHALSAPLFLLSDKPTIFACNVRESDLATADSNPYVQKVRDYVGTHLSCEAVVISAQIESDLVELSPEEAQAFLAELGVSESGIGSLIRSTYHLLGLRTYFTAGEKEVRAWTIHAGDTAPKAAGVIHSDFERGFIKAETVAYDDLIRCGSVAAAREQGLYRMEGKEYVVADGDVLLFKFNV